MIIIQKKDFNLEKEINKIKSKYLNVGAVSNFVGYVKDLNNNRKVSSIVLDVYQDMAYNSLKNICQKAKKIGVLKAELKKSTIRAAGAKILDFGARQRAIFQ